MGASGLGRDGKWWAQPPSKWKRATELGGEAHRFHLPPFHSRHDLRATACKPTLLFSLFSLRSLLPPDFSLLPLLPPSSFLPPYARSHHPDDEVCAASQLLPSCCAEVHALRTRYSTTKRPVGVEAAAAAAKLFSLVWILFPPCQREHQRRSAHRCHSFFLNDFLHVASVPPATTRSDFNAEQSSDLVKRGRKGTREDDGGVWGGVDGKRKEISQDPGLSREEGRRRRIRPRGARGYGMRPIRTVGETR